jgi:hypothetical protein
MSTTSNIQNYLVNVFRPIYVYDAATTLFIPKLTLSNIDTYYGNVVNISNLSIRDSNFNVYVGANAGNSYSNLANSSNNTTVGYQAGFQISNCKNNVYVGYNAAANTSDASGTIAVGANSLGGGNSNIYIGLGTGSSASNTTNNILIGSGITVSAGTSNTIRIGTSSISANTTAQYVGINTPSPQTNLDVSGTGYFSGKVGIQTNLNTLSKSLEVNGQVLSSGGYCSLQGSNDFTGTVTIGTLKRGIVLVSAVDTANSANYAARNLFAYTTSNITNLGNDVSAGTAIITTSTSNIVLSNSGASSTYNWNITYFPVDVN